MINEFCQGLITGLAIKPLTVTTEHATPDPKPTPSDVYKIEFDSHNMLTDSNIMTTGSWGDYAVKSNLIFVDMNANMSVNWYNLTNAFDLETNCLYKLTCTHTYFYGRFGVSTHGTGNAIYNYEYQNCACAYGTDNRMLNGEGKEGVASNIFMVIPKNNASNQETVHLMWCSDVIYNGAKEAFSVGLGLYKQIL